MISPLLLLSATLAFAGTPLPPQALPTAPHPAASVPSSQQRGGQPLRFCWTRDAALTAGAAALLLSSESLFKDALAPSTCRWCDRNARGEDTLNAVDRWAERFAGDPASQKRASAWSDVVAMGMLPVGVLGTGYLVGRGSGSDVLAQDALMVAQAVLISSSVNQVVKFAAGRERPFVRVLPEEERARTGDPSDNNMSFYSGHTSLAFALAASAGTVAQLRGYKHSGWVWAVGMPLAASVPVLRMAAGKHYLSDVAVGAVLGTAFGVGVPLLLHPRRSHGTLEGAAANDDVERAERRPRVQVSAGAGTLSVSGVF
jgi:membrane-associated phospholipid phosphatase